MVALGITGLIGLALVELTRNGLVSQKALVATDDSRTVTNDIRVLMENGLACLNTFGGSNPVTVGFAVNNVQDLANKTQFSVNGIYGNRSLQLKSISVGNVAPAGVDPRTGIQKWIASAAQQGTALVVIEWDQTGVVGSSTGPSKFYRYFLIDVVLNGANQIISCQSEAGGTAASNGTGIANYLAIWQNTTTLGQSAIYQKGSFIGINTAAVVAGIDLDVFSGSAPGTNGSLRVGDITATSTISATGNITIAGTITAAMLLLTSDEREKTQIKSLNTADSLEKLSRVRPVSFQWKKGAVPDQGVIAQELRKVFPELVVQNEDGHFSVRYTSLSAPIIASIQELNIQQEKLQTENRELRARLERLEAVVRQLENKK